MLLHAQSSKLLKLLGCFVGSGVIAISAQICIPLIPVPITLQTLGVFLVGALLGARYGAFAVLLYLAEGMAGAPVFAKFSSGLHVIFGPTGGYLIGFVFAAYLTGALFERLKKRTFFSVFLAGLAGELVSLLAGYLQLTHFVGYYKAFTVGIMPFIIGDFLKLTLFALLMSSPRGKKS
ncbi:MAG: biotin transporter BioY [Holosporales bacterium]|jgi:biotin transport system substrate-specific component|nr:biotin transporter BioY [Holosporales bacterium]